MIFLRDFLAGFKHEHFHGRNKASQQDCVSKDKHCTKPVTYLNEYFFKEDLFKKLLKDFLKNRFFLYFHFCVPFLTVVTFQIVTGEIGAWKDGRFLSFSVTAIDFETLETMFVFVAKSIQRIYSYTWSFFESI